MVKNSTLFFYYSNFDSGNHLLTSKDINEPEGLYTKELEKIFEGICYSPSKKVMSRILQELES